MKNKGLNFKKTMKKSIKAVENLINILKTTESKFRMLNQQIQISVDKDMKLKLISKASNKQRRGIKRT